MQEHRGASRFYSRHLSSQRAVGAIGGIPSVREERAEIEAGWERTGGGGDSIAQREKYCVVDAQCIEKTLLGIRLSSKKYIVLHNFSGNDVCIPKFEFDVSFGIAFCSRRAPDAVGVLG